MVGLYSLYERAGGVPAASMIAALQGDRERDDHPLLLELRDYCLHYRTTSFRLAAKEGFTYRQFYDAFLAQYLPCYTCELAKKGMRLLCDCFALR